MPPQKPDNLPPFLGRIVRNLSISRWRREHAKKRPLWDFVPIKALFVPNLLRVRILSVMIIAKGRDYNAMAGAEKNP